MARAPNSDGGLRSTLIRTFEETGTRMPTGTLALGFRTAFTAVRLGLPGFLLPFILVVRPEAWQIWLQRRTATAQQEGS